MATTLTCRWNNSVVRSSLALRELETLGTAFLISDGDNIKIYITLDGTYHLFQISMQALEEYEYRVS